MVVQPERRLFTVDEYHHLAEVGILAPDDRVELIGGELYHMPPIGPAHSYSVDWLNELFVTKLEGRAIVRVQSSVRLDQWSEPEPDVTILERAADRYAQRYPGPDDILLVVEVAKTTAVFDRGVKLAAYARTGVPEAWLVDLTAGQLEVHLVPGPDGYGRVETHRRGDAISPSAFPDLALDVADILGP